VASVMQYYLTCCYINHHASLIICANKGSGSANVVPALAVINIKVCLFWNSVLVVLLSVLNVFCTGLKYRIYPKELFLCSEILVKLHEVEVTSNDMPTSTEESVAKQGRDTTDGKVKYLLAATIII